MKHMQLIYWTLTILFSLSIISGATLYIFNYENVKIEFVNLGFPEFVIIPLAVAKFAGVLAILTNRSRTLSEWAYAGFSFNLLLAIGAHLSVNDGEWYAPAVVATLMIGSYLFNKKRNKNDE